MESAGEIEKMEAEFKYLLLRAMFCGEEERERYIIPRLREILDRYEALKGGKAER
jgi:hypothetical protein